MIGFFIFYFLWEVNVFNVYIVDFCVIRWDMRMVWSCVDGYGVLFC